MAFLGKLAATGLKMILGGNLNNDGITIPPYDQLFGVGPEIRYKG